MNCVACDAHGRSMEEEARELLKAGLIPESAPRLNLAQSIRRHRTSWRRGARVVGTGGYPPSLSLIRTYSRKYSSRRSEMVHGWLAAQDPSTVFTTTISQAELLYG